MTVPLYEADVVIAGGGLAGLVTAWELLERDKSVVLIEKDTQSKLGGMAKDSFGGVLMVGTPHQKRTRVRDNPDLAYRDWESTADFGPADEWPKKWARYYCDHSLEMIYQFLDRRRVKFLPMVNWPERGLFVPGNSVPRWHITWGTGAEIIAKMIAALEAHPRRPKLKILFEHGVSKLEQNGGRITGVSGNQVPNGQPFQARAESVVIASGGICGGDLSYVRAHWNPEWGTPPKKLLNGSHRYADGLLLEEARGHGARLTHLEKQWHYSSGVHHPAKRLPEDGLSLLPPRSALWFNPLGERIGPVPLMGYTDTRYLVETILKQPGQYSWQVMNWKIAIKEIAVSGCDYMTAFRLKKKMMLLKNLLFGDRELVSRLIAECPDDIVTAQTVPELVRKMNERGLYGMQVSEAFIERAVRDYDAQIERGPKYFTDDQLRRIMSFRGYPGDRIRLCKYQKIRDPGAMPLIAIREFILSRKSLGGIQTDLQCRVLNQDGVPISGLYAVGEAAGFGGGGIHGKGSLEGTFLGSCVLTGQLAGRAIAGGG